MGGGGGPPQDYLDAGGRQRGGGLLQARPGHSGQSPINYYYY